MNCITHIKWTNLVPERLRRRTPSEIFITRNGLSRKILSQAHTDGENTKGVCKAVIDERIIVSTRNLHKEDLFRVANKTSLKQLRWKVSAAVAGLSIAGEEADRCYRSLGCSEYFCNHGKESYWLLHSERKRFIEAFLFGAPPTPGGRFPPRVSGSCLRMDTIIFDAGNTPSK